MGVYNPHRGRGVIEHWKFSVLIRCNIGIYQSKEILLRHTRDRMHCKK